MHKDEDLDAIEIIDAHLENFFEEDEVVVFHDPDQDQNENHIDVYWIKPNLPDRPYSILMTCGVSRFPLNIPEDAITAPYIELVMTLPPDWFSETNEARNQEELWPIHHLMSIGKIPYRNKTWLGFGHTISWSPEGKECFPGTDFISTILAPNFSYPESFATIEGESKTIKLFTAMPLYPEELELKMEEGSNALFDKFEEFGLEDMVDLKRVNSCS
jgi:hypothetical protein